MPKRSRLILIGVPLGLCAAFVYPYIPWVGAVPCAVKYMTGVVCPGCGFVRSVSALVHGDMRGSLGYNPMGIVAVVVAAYLWVRSVLSVTLMSKKAAKIAGSIFVAGLFVQWILKVFIGGFNDGFPNY